MNEITNVTNEVAADIAAQLTNGTAEVIEEKAIKRGLSTGNAFADAGILTVAVGGAAALGVLFGIKHERKKWESYEDDCDDEDEDEDFEEYEEFEDDEDYKEEPTDTKEAEKTDKPEK